MNLKINKKKRKDKKKTYKEHKHRELTSHMIWSHIFLIAASLWWLFGKNDGPFLSHCFDKFMAIILTIAILMSLIFHYYYEKVLTNIERPAQILGVIVLNLYLIYRGVPYYFILFGLVILIFLDYIVKIYSYEDNEVFEKYHPYCHYIAGFYVFYCVFFIQRSFQ